MPMIDFFLIAFVSFFYLADIDMLVSIFAERKETSKLTILLAAIYLPIGWMNAHYTLGVADPLPYGLSLLLFYSLPIILPMFRYRAKKLLIVYTGFTFLSFDSITESTITLLLNFWGIEFEWYTANMFVSLIFGIAAFLFLRFYCLKRREQIGSAAALPKKSFYVLLLITLLTIGSLSANIMLANTDMTLRRSKINIAMTLITVLVTLTIIIALFTGSVSKQYFENNLKMMEKQMSLQIAHYEKLTRLNDEIRSFRHDYKNHMRALQSILENGTSEEAIEYVKDITKQELIESGRFSTGNPIADSILEDKNNDAQTVGGTIKFSGYISDEISHVDICTILSNALDNAVEACGRISSDEVLTIKVKCAVEQGIQVISITNPNYGDAGDLSTSKEDKINHGFGLFNIRRTIEKLDGELSISRRSPDFALDIEFPIHTM